MTQQTTEVPVEVVLNDLAQQIAQQAQTIAFLRAQVAMLTNPGPVMEVPDAVG